MNDTFMKTRPVLPLLVSMALPNVISMLVNSLYNIVDSLFVARISEQAMTALSLVFPVQNLVNAISIGFGIGINAQIALHLGAGDREKADISATHGMALSILHGLLCTVAGIAIMPGFLRRFTSDESLVSMGVLYATIVFLFSIVNMADLAFEKMFQAVGRMNTTMIALIAGCVCNIALDPVLIFGLGPVPALGIAGAALATNLGQLVTLCIYLYCYATSDLPVRLRRRYLHFEPALDGKLYAIGIPAILNLALPSLLVTFLNGLLAAFSQSYVTVLGIYYKLQTFLYLPANGIVQGMRPLVGYNYGAREHGRVARLYNLTLGLSAAIMAVGTVLCLTISGSLIGLFSSNPETIAIGTTALRIICLGFVVSAVSTTSSGALEGLGKGVPSLVISLCRYVIFIMPLAWAPLAPPASGTPSGSRRPALPPSPSSSTTELSQSAEPALKARPPRRIGMHSQRRGCFCFNLPDRTSGKAPQCTEIYIPDTVRCHRGNAVQPVLLHCCTASRHPDSGAEIPGT